MGEGRREMGDGRWEKGEGDGRREMGDGRWEMGEGRREMGDGTWEMGEGLLFLFGMLHSTIRYNMNVIWIF
jgi:hypothetical protein